MKRAIGIVVVLFSFIAVTSAAAAETTEGPVIIAAAASMTYPLTEIIDDFKKTHDSDVELVFDASGALTTKIRNGAPFDIFFSANMAYPEKLYAEGLTTAEPFVYAYGTLVAWSCSGSIGEGTDLRTAVSESTKIACADPAVAPYGVAAVNALKAMNVYDAVEDKIVYGQSVSQVNHFVLSQAVSLGFTAKSGVLAPAAAGKGVWIEVDRALYQPIAQGCVVITHAAEAHRADVDAVVAYCSTEKAQEILKKYGYTV